MGTQNRRLNPIRAVNDFYENRRLALQTELDAQKTIEERRKLGQFATPTSLAREVVSFGISSMDSARNIKFFDPAFGTGAFYSALLAIADANDIAVATAVEIDPLIACASDSFWHDCDINIINADFTDIEPDDYYNLVICNPPYVRHHLIDVARKLCIKNKTEMTSGVKLSGLAGLYCHFLLQSVRWMEEDAVAGWLIPSEFMDVNYGKALKHFLLSEVELFRIHRFNPNDIQFEDALVSSAVVWFRKRKPTINCVTFTYGGTLESPNERKSISTDILYKETKWTRFPCLPQRQEKEHSPKLRDYFDVKRGIATGGNSFFIIEESRVLDLGLPLEFFRPVLPSARHVQITEIESDEFGNPVLPQRLFLLDCRLSEEEVRDNYPLLWDYLESGRESVGSGYLCKSRKCWYFQEQREAPMLICTYMGRQSTDNDSAFRFILNNSRATVTNSYLALYPHRSLLECLAQKPDLKRTVWELLNTITPDSLHSEGRVYGGGLQKIEPKELLNVDVPFFEDLDIPRDGGAYEQVTFW
ncbi:MAG: Eco57I restriction-modification methylase domain-containing protein [Oscillospiraceae bacterium]|nr:Eco57I restriction-modification methylase domain-containing protein [Oscillospiraceae bacterium]